MKYGMRLPIRALALLVTLSTTLLLPTPVTAFCGLQSCPRPAAHGETPMLEAGLRTRWVAFDIDGNEGSYVITAPRVFARHAGFTLGAEAPLTRLHNRSETATGFSNPVLMAQYARRLSTTWSGEIGLQVELPYGDQDKGLAGDHVMLLPWIGARKDLGTSWYAAGMLGVSRAFGGHHGETGAPLAKAAEVAKVTHEGHEHEDGSTTPVLVNPHADREIQWRAATGWTRGRSTLEGFTLAQHDITGEESASGSGFYLRTGASWEWALGRVSALQLIADVPVTAARRNEVEIGLALRTGW